MENMGPRTLNFDLSCDFIKCLPPLGSSDHNFVSFALALSLPVIHNDENSNFRLDFSRAEWNSLSLTRALSIGPASFQAAPLLQTCGLNSRI
jgi:hypothetical protein